MSDFELPNPEFDPNSESQRNEPDDEPERSIDEQVAAVRQTWRLVGGPFDGMEIVSAVGVPVAYEIRLANGHCRPFWESTYMRRPLVGLVFTAESILHPSYAFDYVCGSETVQQVAGLDRQIQELHEKLQEKDRRIARLEGTIKGMKARKAKRKGKGG